MDFAAPERAFHRDLSLVQKRSKPVSLGNAPLQPISSGSFGPTSVLIWPWTPSVAVLQVFAHRFRTGVLAPSSHTIRARTVENAVRSVGQAFTLVG
jgi:hypothetical protein